MIGYAIIKFVSSCWCFDNGIKIIKQEGHTAGNIIWNIFVFVIDLVKKKQNENEKKMKIQMEFNIMNKMMQNDALCGNITVKYLSLF